MIFIRPWFLILLLIPVIFWFFKKNLMPENPLVRFVDKRLLPFLTVNFAVKKTRRKLWGFAGLWTLLVIAGAGPAFFKAAVPAVVSAPSSVIVVDLSPTMNKENVIQAKLKVYDLLKALKGHQAGLVLYDEKGYTAVPLTQDLGVIENMVPALDPSVLPVRANNPVAGFQKAAELFKNAGVQKGQIIFLTAGGFDVPALQALTQKLPHQISIMGLGDEKGTDRDWAHNSSVKPSDTKVPSSQRVTSDTALLSSLGFYTPATVDDADVRAILSRAPNEAGKDLQQSDKTAEIWQDAGPYLLLIGSVFFVLLFRKGVLFLIMIAISFSAEAALFERPDQEQYRKMLGAVEAYQAGNYEAARQIFETSQSAPMIYNKGNALAYLNDIPGAIKAYEDALKLQPDLEQARFNKEYLEKQMPRQQSDTASQDNEKQQKSSSDSASSNAPEQNADQELNSSQKANQQNDENQQAQQKTSSEAQDQSNENNTPLQNQMPQETSQASEQNDKTKPQQNQSGQNNSIEEVKPGDLNQNLSSLDNHSQSMQGEQAQALRVDQSESAHPSSADLMGQNEPDTYKNDDSSFHQNRIDPDKKTIDQQRAAYGEKEDADQTPLLDQASQQLLNKLQQDPSRLLKFRLYQQYKRID